MKKKNLLINLTNLFEKTLFSFISINMKVSIFIMICYFLLFNKVKNLFFPNTNYKSAINPSKKDKKKRSKDNRYHKKLLKGAHNRQRQNMKIG